MTVRELADHLNGRIVGDPTPVIRDIKAIDEAAQGDVSFLANPKYLRFLSSTTASALIVGDDIPLDRSDLTFIVVDDAYKGFVAALKHLRPSTYSGVPGIHPTAVVEKSVYMGKDVSIGPYAVIGSGVVLGDRVTIMSHVVVGDGVEIGSDSVIYAHATLYRRCRIGAAVTIHSSAVIGSDGFGYTREANGSWEKIPQTGSVQIGDNAEIGAGVTIDRGTIGSTVIGVGCKIDNLVHIAHNVRIGDHTVIAAQTGISGSTSIGGRNMIAGQVGIVGHIETTDDVIIEAQSGVSKSLMKPGRYFGHPAKEHSIALRLEGALRQLPDLLREIKEMQQQLETLRGDVEQLEENRD